MALPTSRIEFAEYCLRRLGEPVIQVNVDPEQIQDRIDDALNFYRDYHHDGVEKLYLKHEITAANIASKSVPLTDAIIGVVAVFDIGSSLNTNNLFNIRYQMSLNDLYDLTRTSVIPYYLAMTHISFLESMFVGHPQIRFNRHTDTLHLDVDWDKVTEGNFVIVECYSYLDPETYNNVYKDRFLLEYATALIKKQWGENLKKFDGIAMPGNVTFNGQKIWDEANQEVIALENKMVTTFSLPAVDMLG